MCSKLQLGLAHRTVRCARLVCVNSLLSGLDGGVRLKITGPSGGAPDYPVSHPRRTRRPREKRRGDVAIIHWTVRWCTRLSGEPTVACANSRPRNFRATSGLLQRSADAPDSVRCASQPRGATIGYAKFGRRSRTGPSTVGLGIRSIRVIRFGLFGFVKFRVLKNENRNFRKKI
jgi:hypothetical protein